MAYLRVRINEGSDAQPSLIWDSVWFPAIGAADWAIAGSDETQNRGGLQSKAALHTAVILALFTDARIPDNHPLHYLVADGDPRGWFGDGVDVQADLGEGPLGSLLWVFERAPLTEKIRQWVEAIALQALATLIFQGVAVKIDAQATARFAANQCDLAIQIYGRDGTQTYNYKFDDIWQQSLTSPVPQPFPQFESITVAPSVSPPSLTFSAPGNSQYLVLFGPGGAVVSRLDFSNRAASCFTALV
jgi:phage gp46-like protein